MKGYQTPLIIGFKGVEVDRELEQHLLYMNPAGVILFRRNIRSVSQVKRLIADLRSLLGDIIIAIDHEGGAVNRFPDECPVPPSANALAWTRSKEVVEQGCRLQAQLVAHLGFNLNFAPVLDLAVDDQNEVIGTRAFSGDPQEVVEYAKACHFAHEQFKVATTGKHFPGHGRTIHDSHFTAGAVYHQTEKELEEDLFPFQQAVLQKIPSIMTAHLMYDSLDRKYPASFSRKIIHDLLRHRWGYDGVVISDCVEMAGIGEFNTPRHIVEGADRAGLDLLISSYSLKKSYQFQRELKAEIDQAAKHREGFVQAGQERLNRFMERYCKCSSGTVSMPSLQDSINLHRKTLQKARSAALSGNQKGYCLIELHNRVLEGINTDVKGNRIHEAICSSGLSIQIQEFLTVGEGERFQEIIAHANQNALVVILLTSNAFRIDGYADYIHFLEGADSAVHIACVDPQDLQGICGNEWATRGFNAGTAAMVAAELNALEGS